MKHIETTATAISKIKSNAKKIKAAQDIQLTKALDISAKEAGYEHYHHAARCAAKTLENKNSTQKEADDFKDQVKALFKKRTEMRLKFETAPNYLADGCIFVMQDNDEGYLNAPNVFGRFPPPNVVSTRQMLELYMTRYEREDEETPREYLESFFDDFSNLNFYKFFFSDKFSKVDDVLKEVGKYSFWMPEYVILHGVMYDTHGAPSTDQDGNTVGFRF